MLFIFCITESLSLRLPEHTSRCDANVAILIRENGSDFGKQARQMLLQQRRMNGQQLSQTHQGTMFHVGIVMVELRQQVLVQYNERETKGKGKK